MVNSEILLLQQPKSLNTGRPTKEFTERSPKITFLSPVAKCCIEAFIYNLWEACSGHPRLFTQSWEKKWIWSDSKEVAAKIRKLLLQRLVNLLQIRQMKHSHFPKFLKTFLQTYANWWKNKKCKHISVTWYIVVSKKNGILSQLKLLIGLQKWLYRT